MLSFVWVLYLFLISLVVAFFTFVFFFRKGRIQDSTPAYQKIKFIKEHIPPTSLKGWRLKAVDNGLRVWQKDLSSTAPPWVPGTIYACSGIIPASLREVMNVLRQAGTSREWDPEVQQVLKVLTRTADHDVVSLSASCRGVIAKTVYCVREMFGAENSSVYSRFWNMKSKSEAWLISLFFEDVVPVEGDLWSCFLLSPLENDEDDQTESLLTLVVAPVSSLFASIPRLTSSRVAGLQDYFTHSKPVGSPHKSGGSEVSGTNQSSTSDASVEDLLSSSVTPSGITTEERGEVLPNATEHSVHSLGKSESSELIAEDFQSPDLMESESNDELNRKLIEVYEATEETDGWALVGNVKGVDILKRPAPPGERPWDCLKGTSVVHVPVHYVLAYIYSLDYRGEWDDLYLKGEVVEEYDPLTKVSRMEYKPIWPASGRDFCNCVMLRELSEGLYGVASEAVVHEDCPERRGLVRGEIIIGGFVVKEISSDPPSCQVTYMTRVDLKGNLPARIVNRVTASQPQAVAVLREKLEALYKQDVESGGQEMSKIQQEGVDLWVNLMKVKEARIQASGGTPVSVRREEGAASEERASISGWSLADRSDSESLNLPPDVQEMLEASNMSEESEMFSLTEENMQLPFLDKPSHHVDYRTLANQTAANLMGELLLASKVEISMSEELNFTEAKEGEWSYQSIEKDVVILRKITPGEKIYSFLGKGMIKVKPPAVWQAVRNHMTRHVYDRMLKKTKLVKQIDEQTRIIYLHHETTQCFVKQSRDFVVLTTERVEPEKYVIAGTSIDIPQLPPTKNIVRGKVYASGWIIEPVLQQGQLFSMVSYLSQVDFGGAVPTRLLNMIARRQPLCIAYLRDYLEKFNK